MEQKDQFPEFEPDYTEVEKRQIQQESNDKELKQNQQLHDTRQNSEGNDQQQSNQKEMQQNNQSDDNQKEEKLNDLIHDIDNKQGRNF